MKKFILFLVSTLVVLSVIGCKKPTDKADKNEYYKTGYYIDESGYQTFIYEDGETYKVAFISNNNSEYYTTSTRTEGKNANTVSVIYNAYCKKIEDKEVFTDGTNYSLIEKDGYSSVKCTYLECWAWELNDPEDIFPLEDFSYIILKDGESYLMVGLDNDSHSAEIKKKKFNTEKGEIYFERNSDPSSDLIPWEYWAKTKIDGLSYYVIYEYCE